MTDSATDPVAEQIVVFDLGMVLASPHRLYESLGEILGTSPWAVEQAFWAHRHSYDEGRPDLEFWEKTLPLIEGAKDVNLSEAVPRLVAADVAGWSVIRPAARQILHDLADRGQRTAILSNAPTSFASASRGFDWFGLVGTWFFSGPLGVAKPDPAIYESVEKAYSLPGSSFWFIDDKQVNVTGAADRGWHAHLWSDDTDTRSWLASEGFLAEATDPSPGRPG